MNAIASALSLVPVVRKVIDVVATRILVGLDIALVALGIPTVMIGVRRRFRRRRCRPPARLPAHPLAR
jgi:hypothetical protein